MCIIHRCLVVSAVFVDVFITISRKKTYLISLSCLPCVILKHSRTMTLNMSRSDMEIRYQTGIKHARNFHQMGWRCEFQWISTTNEGWGFYGHDRCQNMGQQGVLLIFHSAVPCFYWEDMTCELAWIGKAVSSWTVAKQSVDVDLSRNLFLSFLLNKHIFFKAISFTCDSPPQPVQAESLGQSTCRGAWIIRDNTSTSFPKVIPGGAPAKCGEIGPSLVQLPSDPR